MAEVHLPGMAVVLMDGERVLWEWSAGWANIENEVTATADTLFLVGSLSKTVVATALMQLWERGYFNLYDDINDYLPFPVRNPQFPDIPITFRELATHTSSIMDNGPLMEALMVEGDSPVPLGDFLFDYLHPDGAYFDPEANFWPWPPAMRWKYCNIAASLAAYLVEVLSGEDFAEYCRAHVFAPLGMTQSSYRLADLDLDNVAMPYHYSPLARRHEPYGHFGFPYYPSGSVRTSAYELARLAAMYVNEGELGGVRVLSAESVRQIARPQYPKRWPSQGLFWYYLRYDGDDVFGHQGGGRGVVAKLFYRPDDGVGVILLANGDWGSVLDHLVVEGAMVRLFRAADHLRLLASTAEAS
jgi:CubicO group peptidase (beta-lactamase class C family)